jgi:general secretion pathway protein D
LAAVLVFTLLAASAQTETPASLYKKGQDFEARQEYEAAYSAFLQAWQQKPKDLKYRTAAMRLRFLAGSMHVHKGQQLRDAGKLEEALSEFEKAAAIDPGSFIAAQEFERTKTMIESAKNAAAAKPPAPKSFIERKLQGASAEPIELAPLSNQPITLKMTEDSKLIYESVGKLAGINVLFDPDYTSKRIHVELTGVTLAQALRLIAMESKTFWRVVTPNAIFVASDTASKRKEIEENIIKTFYLKNLSQTTEMQDLVNTLRTLLEVNRITPVPSLGAVVVRATPDQIALADKVISDLDKGRSEVVVDVAVMQVNRDRIRDLGVNLPNSVSVAIVPTFAGVAGTATQLTLDNIGQLTAKDFAVSIPAATATLLYSDNNTKVIQNPQIRAVDGQKATLKIGDRVPVATGSFQAGVAAGGGGVSPLVNTQFQYLDVGVNIDITPTVHGDRSVTLKIALEISSVTGNVNIGGISQPIIGQRRLEHEIRLREGEVNLLGGILEDVDIKSVSGYPGLTNVPILKYLLSAHHSERHQNEIVFVMTPRIIRGQELSEANLKPLNIGTGSTIELEGIEPAPPVKAMQPAGNTNPAASAQPAVVKPAQPPVAPVAHKSNDSATSPAVVKPAQLPVAPVALKPNDSAPSPAAAQPPAAAASGTNPPANSTDGAVLSFNPAKITAEVGQTFTVDLVISNVRNLSVVPLLLQYDHAKLQVTNVSNGGFLAQGEQVVAITQRDDPATGVVHITATRPHGTGGASGQGTLVTLTFTAKAEGQAGISIAKAGLRDSNGLLIPSSGLQTAIEIKPASNPAASTEEQVTPRRQDRR